MMNHINTASIPTDRRPLGYWLAAIDRPLRHTMRRAFAAFGVTRREWRTLTTLHSGPASAADIEAALPAIQHRPHRERRTVQHLLDDLVTRGWASLDSDRYALTPEGERIHDAVLTNVQTVRASVTDGISPEDYATTMSTLERIATNLGWEPGKRIERRGRGRGPHRRRPGRG